MSFLTEKDSHPETLNKENYEKFHNFLLKKGITKSLPEDFSESHHYGGTINLYFLQKDNLQIVTDIRILEYWSGCNEEWVDGGIYEMPLDELNSLFQEFLKSH